MCLCADPAVPHYLGRPPTQRAVRGRRAYQEAWQGTEVGESSSGSVFRLAQVQAMPDWWDPHLLLDTSEGNGRIDCINLVPTLVGKAPGARTESRGRQIRVTHDLQSQRDRSSISKFRRPVIDQALTANAVARLHIKHKAHCSNTSSR